MFIFNSSAKGWNLWAKLLCGMCALFMCVSVVLALARWNYLKRAVVTKATITNLIESKSDGNTLYSPVYVFTDQQGQSVKVISSIASFPPPGEVGDQIEVLYDPKDPQRSIQNRFFSVWGVSAILGCLSTFYFIVFGAVVFFTGRYIKKKAERELANPQPPRIPVPPVIPPNR